MELETIRAKLIADARQFITEMEKARGALGAPGANGGGLTGASERSSRALKVLRGGMVSLAVQATQASGPVSKLAQGVLLFGGGGGLVLAVAAGIGALSLAYKALTQDTREAQQAQEDMMKALGGIGAHGQLTAARIRLRELQGALKKLQEPFGPFMNETRGTTGQIEEQQRKIATQLIRIAELEREVAKWSEQMADDAEKEAAARARIAALLRVVPDTPMTALGESLFQRDQARMRGRLGVEIAAEETAKLQGDYFKFAARDIFLKSGISETVKNFGVSVGRQFIMGMLEGIESAQDLFRMVLLSVLDFGIGMLLNNIIPGGSVLGIAGQQVGPASFSVNMNMGGLQPLTAFAISRDPGFQQVIREAILVAGSQGFKG